MKFNFDKVVVRKNTNCVKWDTNLELFGNNDLISMWVADMDFEVPKAVTKAIIKRAKHKIYGYGIKPNSYYESIISWQKRRHNWDIERDWLFYAPGVVPSLNLCVMTFTKPGDKVLIQPPVYPPFFSVIKNNGRQIVENQLKLVDGHYEMDFDDLEMKASDEQTKMILLCSPHNPVGRVWKKDELIRLGDICLKHNVIIVCDEIHGDLVKKGHKHIPIASISKEFMQNTITCISPNKTFNIAGLGSSSIVIPNKELREKFIKTAESNSVNTESIFDNIATEAAYNHGEEWLEQLLEYLDENYKYIAKYCEERIPKIKVMPQEGTYLVWLDCRELGSNQEDLKKFIIEKAKLALNDGVMFGSSGEGFQRINIACPRSILEKALKSLEKAVNSI